MFGFFAAGVVTCVLDRLPEFGLPGPGQETIVPVIAPEAAVKAARCQRVCTGRWTRGKKSTHT